METPHMKWLWVFIILLFIAGAYHYVLYKPGAVIEGLATNDGELRCPNILIQKGARFYLYNSNIAQVPGVNPVAFNNLEEYVEFLEWQRGAGIRCPVLYVQNTYDIQGERVYKIRPSVTEPQGGLPPSTLLPPNPTLLVDASRNDPPYNTGSMPGMDQSSYYVGTTTPLDTMDASENMLHNENGSGDGKSPNPMDDNWGGQQYTQSLVDAGYYKGNEVAIQVA